MHTFYDEFQSITPLQFSHSAVYKSLRPHGLQPTRLIHPWDFPSKSTGVGCHCLLQGLYCQARGVKGIFIAPFVQTFLYFFYFF